MSVATRNITIPAGISGRVDSNPSRSRRTIISGWCCGTSNATRCGPAWWSGRKPGAGPACTRCRPTLRARSGWTRARRLGAPAGWRTSTPRCLTMMLPEYANPYDETAPWAIPPGRWRLPGPWAWNTASAHPAARPGLQWSDQDPREHSAGGSPMRKDRAIQDPEARLPISPIAPQKLPVSPFGSDWVWANNVESSRKAGEKLAERRFRHPQVLLRGHLLAPATPDMPSSERVLESGHSPKSN